MPIDLNEHLKKKRAELDEKKALVIISNQETKIVVVAIVIMVVVIMVEIIAQIIIAIAVAVDLTLICLCPQCLVASRLA